jgi:hypothetical protein
MSLPDGQKAIGEMGKDKDKPGTSTLEEATMERIHDETKRMHETSDKLKSTLVTEKFPDPVAKLAELKAKVADPKTKKEAMAELKELLAPWYKLIEARRAAVKDDPKELALLKKLEDALGDSSFIFKAEGHVDPGAEQLVRRGYFNLNEVTIKGLAKCGWYPGACYGGAFDGMHFRLADPLLPGPGKHATKK